MALALEGLGRGYGDISWDFAADVEKWWGWCGLNFPSTQQITAWWAELEIQRWFGAFQHSGKFSLGSSQREMKNLLFEE